MITLGKSGIAADFPCGAPFFDTFLFIPVVIILFMALVLLFSRFIYLLEDSLTVLVKVIDLAALSCPLPIGCDAANRQHDVSMRIPVLFVVQAPIGTHSLLGQTLNELAHGFDLLRSVKLLWKRNFDLAPQSSVLCVLNLVNRIPKRLPICIFGRRILAKGNL